MRFCLLRPGTKVPVERSWPDKNCDPVQAIADGYGIGLVLGEQPDGQYLIALDVDSEAGLSWVEKRGVPSCPTIWSRRGPKYLFTSPIKVSHVTLADGVEVLGERHQICLPSPYAPDDRRWGGGLEAGIPEAPAWLLGKLKGAKRAQDRVAEVSGFNGRGQQREFVGEAPDAAPSAPEWLSSSRGIRPPCHAPALQTFLSGLAPLAVRSDSNKPLLCAAAIVAYRMDKLARADLVRAVQWANSQLRPEHRVSLREAAAVALSVERHKTRFNPQVLHERTGIPLEACKQMLSFIDQFERSSLRRQRVYLTASEIASRVLATLCIAGYHAQGMIFWRGTVRDLARETSVSYNTLKRYISQRKLSPLLLCVQTVSGRGGGVLLASPIRKLICTAFATLLGKWLQNAISRNGVFCLRRNIWGGGRGEENLRPEGSPRLRIWGYARDEPVYGGSLVIEWLGLLRFPRK